MLKTRNPPKTHALKEESGSRDKWHNVYWSISYSMLDRERQHFIGFIKDFAELESDGHKYRVYPVQFYDDLCNKLQDTSNPMPDFVVVGDDLKLKSAAKRDIAEKKPSVIQKIKNFYRKHFPKYKEEVGESENYIVQCMDFMALRLSDPKAYCDGLFKSLMEQAAELSDILVLANPKAKLIIHHTYLFQVADEKHRKKLQPLYEEILRDIKQKYKNVVIAPSTETLFFNDQCVESSLLALDNILDGKNLNNPNSL